MKSSETLVDEFMVRLVLTGYRGGIRTMTSLLTERAPGRAQEDPLRQEIREWYLGLVVTDQHVVNQIVEKATEICLFRVLVLLDNLSGGPWSKEKLGDIALSYQEYESMEDRHANRPSASIRLNSNYDLHDLLLEHIERYKRAQDAGDTSL